MPSITPNRAASEIGVSFIDGEVFAVLDNVPRSSPACVMLKLIHDLPCSDFRHYLTREQRNITKSAEALLLLHAIDNVYKKHGVRFFSGTDSRLFTVEAEHKFQGLTGLR